VSEEPIERIRISEIHIGNPRPRNRARWQMIVANIREVGLKNQSPWFAEQLQVLTGKYSISSVARDEPLYPHQFQRLGCDRNAGPVRSIGTNGRDHA
jgi:hypothetical protein